ncbi:MAG TPA: hypothetical protein VF655_07350 [Allosphingosinicella sp.]
MPASTAPTAADGAIIVSGQRPRGSVVSDIRPERTFSPLDIQAYGVSNVGEFLQALGPQVSSSRGGENGRPITLLNGRRVSGFAEIAQIPIEAIETMEVFPEELALKYGYRPDQKVVNIITFERFRSQIGELAGSVATEGGYGSGRIQGSYFAIRGNTRLDAGAEYSRTSPLLESERDLVQPAANRDAGNFRTLVPETERLTVNGLVSAALIDNVSSTFNGRFELESSRSLLGRDENSPLERDTHTRAAHLGTTFHGEASTWLWTATGSYDHLHTRIVTDLEEATLNRATSDSAYANANILITGSLLKLAAGAVAATIRGSVERRDFSSVSRGRGIDQRADLSRDSGAVQANFYAPIASRRAKGAATLGALSVNANVELERLSDFGTLTAFGYGAN